MQHRLKIIFILIFTVTLIVIPLNSCSKKQSNDEKQSTNFSEKSEGNGEELIQSTNSSEKSEVSEEEVMNNLKNLIPYLNEIRQMLKEYKCQVIFCYNNEGLFIIDTKEEEHIAQLEREEELLYNIKIVLDNPHIYGITWALKNNDSDIYEVFVGVKTVRSGYISEIIYGNEGYEDCTVLLGDNWYYWEMQGE